MTDKKEFKGNLMKEGIFVWVVFAPDGKAGLYMDGVEHMPMGTGFPPMYPPFMKSVIWITNRCTSTFRNTGFQYATGYAFDIPEQTMPV